MSFDWLQFLTFAQELPRTSLPSTLHEAMLRSSISRAYYAAFGLARDYLITQEGRAVPRGTNIHWFVTTAFERSSDPSRQVIGHLLHHLRSVRNAADYDRVFPRDVLGVARAALQESREVIQMLEQLTTP